MTNEIKRQTPSGYTMFCEDIRYELNGKFSLMGNFGNTLVSLGPFPLILPKLCLYLSYYQRREDGFEDVKFEAVLIAGDQQTTVWETSIPSSALESTPITEDVKKSDDPVIAMHLPLELQNFLIQGPGRIRVYAQRGEERIRIGSLSITSQPIAETPASVS